MCDDLFPCREVSAVLGPSKGLMSHEQGVCVGVHSEDPGLASKDKTALRKRSHLRAVTCLAIRMEARSMRKTRHGCIWGHTQRCALVMTSGELAGKGAEMPG